jgi:hypothetical protein
VEIISEKVSNEEKAIGLSLIHSPSRFKVVKGVLESLSLKEISSKYGIKYRYVSKLCVDMVRKGLLERTKLFRNSVYIPTPKLVGAFKYACRELYVKVSGLPEVEANNFLSRYGFTLEELLGVCMSYEFG